MAKLHRTPVHTYALRCVWEQRITWDTHVGLYGGFRFANGMRITPGNDLVALYELRDAGLIEVGDGVRLTPAGVERLSEWEQVAR